MQAWLTLLSPDCKYLLYGGAAAGGKSYFLRWAALMWSIVLWKETGIKNLPIGLFSEDYPTLKDRQIARMQREFPPYLGSLKESRDQGYAFHLIDKLGGGIILLRNLDDPSKYASTEFAAEFVEELTKNEESTFEDLRFRLRFPGIKNPKFVAATNPGQKGHAWVKKFWIDGNTKDPEQKSFKFISATYTDNKYIEQGYLDQLKSLPEAKRRAYLDGSWDVFEGQVYSEFDRNIHVVQSLYPKQSFSTYLSFDWGYAAPFASYVSTLVDMKLDDGRVFKRLITWNEWYGIERTPADWAKQIYDDLMKRRINLGVCDPSMLNRKSDGSRPIMEEFEDAWSRLSDGEWIVPIEGGSRDRIKRIALTHAWLSLAPDGLPYWVITENCQNLIRTLPMLVYDKHKIEDLDTTQEDHSFDSISYLISHLNYQPVDIGLFGGKFKDAKIIEMVDEMGQGIMPFDITEFER